MALLGPVIMLMLAPAEYGLFNVAYSFINVLAAVAGLGLRQVMGIEYFHGDRAARISLINDIMIIYLLLAGPLFIGLFFLLPCINHYIFVWQASAALIVVALLICFVRFFTELFYQLLRVQCRAFELFCSQAASAGCTILLAAFFLWHYSWGATGALLSYLLGMAVIVVHALWRYTDKVGINGLCVRSSMKKMGYYLFMGFPFVPSILFDWILSSSDAWMLAHYVDMHQVGIYSAADNIGKLYPLLILYPMAGSYIPQLMHQFAQNKSEIYAIERKNKKTMWLVMVAMAVVITVGCVVFRPVLYRVLPFKYHDSIGYLWVIVIRYVFLMGVYFASTIIQFWKKTYFMAFALCVPALINIALNFLFIPLYGAYGCAISTLMAYVLYFVLTLGYSLVLERRPYIVEP